MDREEPAQAMGQLFQDLDLGANDQRRAFQGYIISENSFQIYICSGGSFQNYICSKIFTHCSCLHFAELSFMPVGTYSDASLMSWFSFTDLNNMAKEREKLGCEHYKRHCRLVAPCCAKVYNCRFSDSTIC